MEKRRVEAGYANWESYLYEEEGKSTVLVSWSSLSCAVSSPYELTSSRGTDPFHFTLDHLSLSLSRPMLVKTPQERRNCTPKEESSSE